MPYSIFKHFRYVKMDGNPLLNLLVWPHGYCGPTQFTGELDLIHSLCQREFAGSLPYGDR
jgi:hypothetical protein